MAKTNNTKTINKALIKELNTKIEKILKELKLKYKIKSNGCLVDERNATIYADIIGKTPKYIVLNNTTGSEIFSATSINRLKNFLDGGKKSKTSVGLKQDKKTETKTKVKKEKKSAKPRWEPLKPIEKVVIKKNELLKLATQPVKLVDVYSEYGRVIEGYRGVYNKSKKKVVSVVSDTYNLLPNKSVIDPILLFLEKNKIKYTFDRFTYVNDTNMRLHFTFPNVKIKDDTKEGILGSMYVHNSYNNSESFNMTAGAKRLICSNGMVANVTFKKLKVIHQAHNIETIALANMEAIFNGFYDNTKKIETRIKEMISTKTTGELIKGLYKRFEIRIVGHVLRELGLLSPDQPNVDGIEVIKNLSDKQKFTLNQWRVYNILTQYISHQTLQRYRLDYLRQVSKTFSL